MKRARKSDVVMCNKMIPQMSINMMFNGIDNDNVTSIGGMQ